MSLGDEAQFPFRLRKRDVKRGLALSNTLKQEFQREGCLA